MEIVKRGVEIVERLRESFSRLRSKGRTYAWKDYMEADNLLLDEIIENQQKLVSLVVGKTVRNRGFPDCLQNRDSGTQSSPPPVPVVTLEDDLDGNEDLARQLSPWRGPEVPQPAQPAAAASTNSTTEGPQQDPPPRRHLNPRSTLLLNRAQQGTNRQENHVVTLVRDAGGTEFLMQQFARMIREEVTWAVDSRLGPQTQERPPPMPQRQKSARPNAEPRSEINQPQSANPPTPTRAELSRQNGGGGGYSETWQEVVKRNYQGVRGPRANTLPPGSTQSTSSSSSTNRFTPLGGGSSTNNRRDPFPMLPPPRQPAPTTPGGKRKKKGGQKG